jgi:hypothetical protein
MEIQYVQVATNLVVGALSAWIAGAIGVRQGLKRAAQEKALDRRLEWYEKTNRAFRGFNEHLYTLIDTPVGSNDFSAVFNNFVESVVEARKCVDEATVYSKRKTLIRMRKLFEKLDQKTHRPANPTISDNKIERKLVNDITSMSERIMFDLTTSTRNLLGMDRIKRKDFEWRRQFSVAKRSPIQSDKEF